ncbi:MAG: hypothetical protein AAFP02_03180 [Bacteroidota bacterium]
MKRISLSIVLLALCLSMTAQDKQYRNTLSLDFSGPAFAVAGLLFPGQARGPFAFVPRLEYRRAFGERMAWRLSFDYHPLSSTTIGLPGVNNFSETRSKDIYLSTGLQYYLGENDLNKNLRFFAFVDIITGREWSERQGSQMGRVEPIPHHFESLEINAALGWGLGAEYSPISRLVIRAELGFGAGVYMWQQINRLEDEVTEIGFLFQRQDPNYSLLLSLPMELSIGWRF